MDSKNGTTLFGGKSVEDWDSQWLLLEGGFASEHRDETHGYVGLFRARRGNEVMYVGCSSAPSGGRLYKRLQQIKADLQSGNDHHGARKIAENIETVVLEVLRLGTTWREVKYTVSLKTAMIRRHRPAWNVRRPSPRRPRK